jgi:hypothetical protein
VHTTHERNVDTKLILALVALLGAAMSCGDQSGSADAGADCDGGTIVDSSSECLQDEAFCRELPDGRFCTGGQAPQCPDGATPIAPGQPCPANMACWEFALSLHCARPIDAPSP